MPTLKEKYPLAISLNDCLKLYNPYNSDSCPVEEVSTKDLLNALKFKSLLSHLGQHFKCRRFFMVFELLDNIDFDEFEKQIAIYKLQES